MYKVMVVDDEAMSRKTVAKMIGELGLGAAVTAEAKNGEEALRLIRFDKPHIVVTDMNMPFMDGERFLETLHREYGEIKAIVVSGYSQFEYLKAALSYQACEYVLKPVSPTELRGAMVKAIGAVSEHRSRQRERNSSRKMLLLRREEFLQHVSSGRIANPFDIRTQAEELGLAPPPEGFRLAVCAVRQFKAISRTKFHGNADLCMFSLENMLYEVLRDDRAHIYKSDDRLRLCVLLPWTSPYSDSRLSEALAAFQRAVNETLGGDVAAGIGPAFGELDKLPEVYLAAIGALRLNRFGGSGLSVRSEDSAGGGSGHARERELLGSFDLKRLGQAFGSGNAGEIRDVCAGLILKLEQRPGATIRDVHRELAKAVRIADEETKGLPSADPSLFDPRSFEEVLGFPELRSFLDRLAEVAEHFGRNRDMPESAQIAKRIAGFLDEHYFEDIGLIDVATRFHLDPAYLSKLFKAATGENFVEYLTRKRMERACELLRDARRKVNEVSDLVGYENQRYFSQVFKKFTGMTPSEYREASAKE